jgi:hypothetical protein
VIKDRLEAPQNTIFAIAEPMGNISRDKARSRLGKFKVAIAYNKNIDLK